MTPKEFCYTDIDGSMVPLNWDLAQTQKLSSGNMELIVQAHCHRVSVFMDMVLTSNDDGDELRALARFVEGLEFELQTLWGFEQDKNFHTWWFKVPHCRCPKIDNADSMYFGRRIITESCPIHRTGLVTEKPKLGFWQRIKRMIGK